MVKSIRFFLLAVTIVSCLSVNAWAALFNFGPVDGDNGFPTWYQDFVQPWYGINVGAAPQGGMKLDLCVNGNENCLPLDPGEVVDPGLGVPGESFWWAAEAAHATFLPGDVVSPPGPNGGALLVLAMEAAFLNENPVAGDQMSFGRLRIRIDVPAAGTYTVTHPFGVEVFEVTPAVMTATGGRRAISDTINATLISSTRNRVGDHGCEAAPCNFGLALDSGVGPWLFWDRGLPVLDAAGNPYIGDGATEREILGSPFGTNFFRIEGPPGVILDPDDGDNIVVQDLFVVVGKVTLVDGNTPPTAVNDAVATLANTPIDIDVIANDTFTNIPINPGSLTVTPPPAGQGQATVNVVNGRKVITYNPQAFVGETSFTYSIKNFAEIDPSATGTVTVTVEDLKVNKADFRPKLLKWRISGTSSDTTDNEIGIQSGPSTVSTTLSGANEVPPVVSGGSGSVSVTVGEMSIDFSLAISGLLNITSTHLHLGAPGTNGPILFTLAGPNIANVSGTLTAADLTLQPAAGINTFADAINAILGGNAYIQVHTGARPAGEIRGQLGPNRLVGTATVNPPAPGQQFGTWTFPGKSDALPGDATTISVRSSNGVRVIDVPLKIK